MRVVRLPVSPPARSRPSIAPRIDSRGPDRHPRRCPRPGRSASASYRCAARRARREPRDGDPRRAARRGAQVVCLPEFFRSARGPCLLRPGRAGAGADDRRARPGRQGDARRRDRVALRAAGGGIALIRRRSSRNPAYQTLAPSTPRRPLPDPDVLLRSPYTAAAEAGRSRRRDRRGGARRRRPAPPRTEGPRSCGALYRGQRADGICSQDGPGDPRTGVVDPTSMNIATPRRRQLTGGPAAGCYADRCSRGTRNRSGFWGPEGVSLGRYGKPAIPG